jgi:hypothetical protein
MSRLELPFPAKMRAQFQQEPRLVRRDFKAFRKDRPSLVVPTGAGKSARQEKALIRITRLTRDILCKQIYFVQG